MKKDTLYMMLEFLQLRLDNLVLHFAREMLLLNVAHPGISLVEYKYSIRIHKHKRDVYHCIVLDLCLNIYITVQIL